MAGGNFILGGLLSGLGRGMEQDYLAKREEALTRLREQNQQAAQVEAENRAEQRDIRKETRGEERDTRKMGVDTENDIRKLEIAGKIKGEDRATEFGYSVKLKQIDAQEDRSTAAFKAKLEANNAAMLEALKGKNDRESIMLRKQLEGDDNAGSITDTNGRVILITKSNKMITTPFTEKEKVDTGDYRSRDRKRGPTPEGFDPNAPPAPKRKWWTGEGGSSAAEPIKVATKAQVQEAAKAKGWTVEQTQRWMRENGWSLR